MPRTDVTITGTDIVAICHGLRLCIDEARANSSHRDVALYRDTLARLADLPVFVNYTLSENKS